jgi:hypothetical protein
MEFQSKSLEAGNLCIYEHHLSQKIGFVVTESDDLLVFALGMMSPRSDVWRLHPSKRSPGTRELLQPKLSQIEGSIEQRSYTTVSRYA